LIASFSSQGGDSPGFRQGAEKTPFEIHRLDVTAGNPQFFERCNGPLIVGHVAAQGRVVFSLAGLVIHRDD
jgi:hypothetical protein